MYTLKKEVFVPKPLDQVFEFFNRPENLSKVTPNFMHFKLLTVGNLDMFNGATFDYKIRLFGLPMYWKSIIRDYNPPYTFVDIQVNGPYKYWHHRHSFVEVDGGVIVKDEVTYDVGYGVVGRLLHTLFIRRILVKIFAFRDRVVDLV